MSNHDKSLEGPKSDPGNFGTVEDQVALSQNQWTSMRGDLRSIGSGASAAAGRIFDRDEEHGFDPEKTSGGFSNIGKGLTEAEKRKIITSAVRGAETAEELADVKDLERVLDHRKDPEDRGYIDCFGDIYKRMQEEKEAGNGHREFHGKMGGGAIGFELSSDGEGSIGRKVADGAHEVIGSAADIGAGIAGHELPGRDDGIFLPPVDNGDKHIGIVPASNPFYSSNR